MTLHTHNLPNGVDNYRCLFYTLTTILSVSSQIDLEQRITNISLFGLCVKHVYTFALFDYS